MKISVNGDLLFELSDHHKMVLANDIDASILEEDLKRRIEYIVMHKYEQCLKRFRAEWEPKLRSEGAESIPCDDAKFCAMVCARSDYKSRAQREEELQKRSEI